MIEIFVISSPSLCLQKGNPRYSEESILQLERELVQARLKEAESQCALKEMQDKILDIEKVDSFTLPDHETSSLLFILWQAVYALQQQIYDCSSVFCNSAAFVCYRGTHHCQMRAT